MYISLCPSLSLSTHTYIHTRAHTLHVYLSITITDTVQQKKFVYKYETYSTCRTV